MADPLDAGHGEYCDWPNPHAPVRRTQPRARAVLSSVEAVATITAALRVREFLTPNQVRELGMAYSKARTALSEMHAAGLVSCVEIPIGKSTRAVRTYRLVHVS